MLSQLERITGRMTQGLTLLGFASLLLLALATVVDVVGRGLFRQPVYGVGDLAAVIMAVIVASALPACFAEKRNIGVDLLGQAMGRRGRAALDLFGHLASLVFLTIFAWQLVLHAAEIARSGQSTWVLRLPLAPWWWMAAGIACLAVPVQGLVVMRALAELGGSRPLSQEADLRS